MIFNRLKINKIIIYVASILLCTTLIYLKFYEIEINSSSNFTDDQSQFSAIVQDNKINCSESAENKFEFNATLPQIPIYVVAKNGNCSYPEILNFEQFFQYGEKEKFCKKLVAFGGRKKNQKNKYNDGEKYVCLDEVYNIKPGNCTVLSFGISYDWSFDDHMDKFGCKVYSFDPSIGHEDYNRSKNIRFFNLGLSDSKRQMKFGKRQGQVDRYKSILEMLNLMDREIDYLKIDIEGSELNFFKDIFLTSYDLLKNVKQIGMEIHPGRVRNLEYKVSKTSRIYQFWHDINQLECAGFKLLSYEKNIDGKNPFRWRNRNESNCYEIVWGKIPSES